MKTQTKIWGWALVVALVAMISTANAQTNYQSNAMTTTVKGTSTLHDWDMSASNGSSHATFSMTDGALTGISVLTFTVAAEALKSDRSGLDKNAYKALNTEKHKNITFTMTKGTVTAIGANTFQVRATGNLTIGGTSKQTTITATAKYNVTDKSITVNGSTKFNMTEYKVTPPTVMMGTIKTGDAVTVEYSGKLMPK